MKTSIVAASLFASIVATGSAGAQIGAPTTPAPSGPAAAAAFGQTQALDPRVDRIGPALDVAPLDHLAQDLRHALIGDLEARGQLALAQLVVGQSAKYIAISTAQIVEAFAAERRPELVGEALVGEAQQDAEVDAAGFLFNHG